MSSLCENCKNESICKYREQMSLINKEIVQFKSKVEVSEPIKIELNCARFEKVNRKPRRNCHI